LGEKKGLKKGGGGISSMAIGLWGKGKIPAWRLRKKKVRAQDRRGGGVRGVLLQVSVVFEREGGSNNDGNLEAPVRSGRGPLHWGR